MRRSDVGIVNRRRNNPTNMEPMKLQVRSGRPGYRNPQKFNSKSGIILYTSIAFFVALLCYMYISHTRNSRNDVQERYAIVIDGGSTGTRIHVFEYKVKDGNLVFDFGKSESMKVNPGLSAYEEDPEKAESAMGELVEFGKSRVPKEYWGNTEIRLMATAGLRMLKIDVQRKILEVCRRVLRHSGFRFQDDWASVISGSDEGVYAWVVANFALGTLGGDPQETTGIIELGGASAQVTFVSNEPLPSEFARTIKYGNSTYNLYSHSLLQFGQNVAFDLLRESFIARDPQLVTYFTESGKPLDPCTPRGYSPDIGSLKLPTTLTEKNKYMSSLHPSGNFTACRSASLNFLQKDKERCSYKNCYIGSTFIPELQGKFLATENFYHTTKFFGLGQPQVSLSDLMVAGQRFCEEDWSNLRRKYYGQDEEDLLQKCFSSAYIIALLHDSLGIQLDDQRIGFTNQVDNIPLDWALGAFLLQRTAAFDQENSRILAYMIINELSSPWLLFGVVLMLTATLLYFTGCGKPQLKTIYDLEKGKYIVTHVRRYS